MITNQQQLALVHRMIAADEQRLERKLAEAEALRKYIHRLRIRRDKLVAEIAREEADKFEAPIVKTQPTGVVVEGWSI